MQKKDQTFSPSENQLAHIIKEQIEAPVKCLLKEGHTVSAAKLILSGIDLMGYLTLPDGRHKVVDTAFRDWTKDYMELVKSGRLDPEEIWQARCDLLHAHGYRDHAEDKPLRYIVFSELTTPPAYEGGATVQFIHVSTEELLNDYLDGARKCISYLYAERDRATRTQNRLEHVQYVRSHYITYNGQKITYNGMPLTYTGGLSHLRKLPKE